MKKGVRERKISRLFKTLGHPIRLQILLAIGEGEACVCHLEAVLGMRQALISQHLMALRKARLLRTRREGRYIYYRLRDRGLLALVELGGQTAGAGAADGALAANRASAHDCACPSCAPELEAA